MCKVGGEIQETREEEEEEGGVNGAERSKGDAETLTSNEASDFLPPNVSKLL